jgi:anaerobic selenocysteine-containing dehydrogenase
MESVVPGELVLIGRRQLRSSNSWLHNSARLVKGKPRTLLVNPVDAER